MGTSRRGFLQSIAAGSAMAVVHAPAASAEEKTRFDFSTDVVVVGLGAAGAATAITAADKGAQVLKSRMSITILSAGTCHRRARESSEAGSFLKTASDDVDSISLSTTGKDEKVDPENSSDDERGRRRTACLTSARRDSERSEDGRSILFCMLFICQSEFSDMSCR